MEIDWSPCPKDIKTWPGEVVRGLRSSLLTSAIYKQYIVIIIS